MNRLSASLLALTIFVVPSSAIAHGRHSGGARSSGGVEHVRGYTTKNGTHVAGYDRTKANGTKADNWSTKGNVNPETGKPGTKPPQ